MNDDRTARRGHTNEILHSPERIVNVFKSSLTDDEIKSSPDRPQEVSAEVSSDINLASLDIVEIQSQEVPSAIEPLKHLFDLVILRNEQAALALVVVLPPLPQDAVVPFRGVRYLETPSYPVLAGLAEIPLLGVL